MALSLNECLLAQNGGRPVNRAHMLAMQGQMALRGSGAGAGLRGLSGRNAGAMHQAWLNQDALKKKAEGLLQQARQTLQQSRTNLANMAAQVRAAETAARSSGDPSAFGVTQQLTDAQYTAQTALEDAESKLKDFESTLEDFQSRGSGVGATGGGREENGGEWMRVANQSLPQVKSAAAVVNRTISDVGPLLGQLQAKQAQVQGQLALQIEQQRLDRELQAKIRQDELDRQDRERIAADQREQQRLDREATIRREEREYEDRLEQQRLDREAAIRAEAAAARGGETQYQQMLLQMEADRAQAELDFRREQAAREEEREVRREEQEAMLQQLLLMQELGVQSPTGMPGAAPGGYPPGYGQQPPAFPQQFPGQFPAQQQFPGAPGYQGGFGPPQQQFPGYGAPQQQFPGYGSQVPYYGPPAAPGSVSAYPGQTGALPGPPSFPGQTYAPSPYGPPAFAQRPQYMQSGPTGIPQQQAPPGMQWAQFDPANEMFGMGNYGGRRLPFVGSAQAMGGLGAADQAVSNPSLKGGQVELGYSIYGPSLDANGKDFYTFEAPDGASWMVFANQVIGPYATPQRDPRTNLIIYNPPSGGSAAEEDFDWNALQSNLRQFVGTGVTAYQQVALTRELEKGARQTRREARGSGYGPQYDPGVYDLAFGERAPVARRGVPGWAIGLGLGTVGLAIVLGTSKRGKRR